MIDLCKLFGVEEGEEFRFIRGAIGKTTYKLQDNQLLYYDENACKFVASALFINELNNISGTIKLPKKKEFSDDELAIMRSLPKEYEWIARDKATNIVCAHGNKPKKSEYETWHSEGSYYAILGIFNHLFKSITSEDEEPVFINDYVQRYNTPKLGTKIRIIDAGLGATGCNRCIGIVTDEESSNGLLEHDEGYNVKIIKSDNSYISKLIRDGYVWRIHKDAEIEILDDYVKRGAE
jgi:hypothetical protein